MKVSDVIRRKDALLGSSVTVEGELADIFGEMYLAQNEEKERDRSVSIRIAQRDELREKYSAIVPPRIGGPIFSNPAQVTGVLSESGNPDFPVEIREMTLVIITQFDETYRLDF